MTWLHIFDIVYRASFLGQVQGRVGVAADVLLVTYIFFPSTRSGVQHNITRMTKFPWLAIQL